MNDCVTVISDQSTCGGMRMAVWFISSRLTQYNASETLDPPAVSVAVATRFEITVSELDARVSDMQNERYNDLTLLQRCSGHQRRQVLQ
jgi:hypothetical protein